MDIPQVDSKLVMMTKRIDLGGFPDAFNPSILKVPEGFLLAFRYCPDPFFDACTNFIGVALLNEALELISYPHLLNTRTNHSSTPSQAEDARLFTYRGKIYLIYNDNLETIAPMPWQRRDMFMAEFLRIDGRYILSTPIQLRYLEKYDTQWWQKNWVPFEWNQKLLLTYMVNPHEILQLNFLDGTCYRLYETSFPSHWKYGTLRGSTPPQLVDGEYLAFFHSGIPLASPVTGGYEQWHYFMGAYTFSKDPPFRLTKISPVPIVGERFYEPRGVEKHVIFPGGFIVEGNTIYLAYGKDDCEVWVAKIDKTVLQNSLQAINHQN